MGYSSHGSRGRRDIILLSENHTLSDLGRVSYSAVLADRFRSFLTKGCLGSYIGDGVGRMTAIGKRLWGGTGMSGGRGRGEQSNSS